MNIKPIETVYNGYRFRSRLEARWAVFFDALDIHYQYELEGWNLSDEWYLPDFYLPDWNTWVEIKPKLPSGEEFRKILKLQQGLIELNDKEFPITSKCMFICGYPGLPLIKFNETNWKFRSGYVILKSTSFKQDVFKDDELETFQVDIETSKKQNKNSSSTKPKRNTSLKPIKRSDVATLTDIDNNKFTTRTELHLFAMVDGGADLDVWPLYIAPLDWEFPDEQIEKECQPQAYIVPHFPSGFVVNYYLGSGIYYDSEHLMNAYRKAKQVRFEHH